MGQPLRYRRDRLRLRASAPDSERGGRWRPVLRQRLLDLRQRRVEFWRDLLDEAQQRIDVRRRELERLSERAVQARGYSLVGEYSPPQESRRAEAAEAAEVAYEGEVVERERTPAPRKTTGAGRTGRAGSPRNGRSDRS